MPPVEDLINNKRKLTNLNDDGDSGVESLSICEQNKNQKQQVDKSSICLKKNVSIYSETKKLLFYKRRSIQVKMFFV